MTAHTYMPPRWEIFRKLKAMDSDVGVRWGTMNPFLGAFVLRGELIESCLIEDDLPPSADGFVIHVGNEIGKNLQHAKEMLNAIPHEFYGLVFGGEFLVSGDPQTVRLFMAVDRHGRVYQLSRLALAKAAEPDIELLDEEDAPRLLRHDMTIALLRITRALAVWLPDDGVTLARMEKLLEDVP